MNYETQKIDLKGIPNARQLGGYIGYEGKRVKFDTVFRTGSLYRAEASAIKLLEEKYHLSDIIDFRMPQETAVMREPDIPGAKYHHISVLNDIPVTTEDFQKYTEAMRIRDLGQRYLIIYNAGIEIKIDAIYKSIFCGADGKAGYKKFFEILLGKKENAAVLFHCTQGKDRTGIGAMLLLFALGVDKETILKDYMMTNEACSDLLDAIKRDVPKASGDKKVLETALFLESVNESFILPLFDIADREYGGIMGYLKTELKLNDKDISDLRKIYLE